MSPLPLWLWREADPEVFRGTIVAAAERLDVLPLDQVHADSALLNV
jgi:hypothetical protein